MSSGGGSGTFAPAPGAAPTMRMLAAQSRMELRETLRNGEQLLLTLLIPVLLLAGFSTLPLLASVGTDRVTYIAPGVIALAIMSTAFTSLAIKTGFERDYGVLKRLGATPLPRWGLLVAKTAAVITVELLQLAVLVPVAAGLGWRPHLSGSFEVLILVLLVLLGTAAFSGLGLLLAGTLRAEATLAAANLVYLLLLGLGGVIFPLTEFPGAIRPVLELLPVTALADGLRGIFDHGGVLPGRDVLILTSWVVASLLAASRLFKWE